MLGFLRWLRGSDAVRLTWDEIDFEVRETNRLTQKRKKPFVLRVCEEFLFALEAERDRRKPQPGNRAGIPDAPASISGTPLPLIFWGGATPHDVAKL